MSTSISNSISKNVPSKCFLKKLRREQFKLSLYANQGHSSVAQQKKSLDILLSNKTRVS